MSFKEQLKTDILPKTVEYYNSEMGINEAIVKAAEDFKLNLDQTDRLMETMNTARVIAHYEKNAEDRTANCDIADKDTIRRLLYADKPQEKSASAPSGASWGDYAPYFFKERNYRMAKAIEKAAAEKAPEKPKSEFTNAQAVMHVSAFAREVEGQRKFAEESIEMVRSHVATNISKIAASLSRGYEPEKRYALFKVAAAGRADKVLSSVASSISKHIVKAAAQHIVSLGRRNVLDTSPVDAELALAVEVEDDISKIAEMRGIAEECAKVEREVKDTLRKYAEAVKLAGPFGAPLPPPSSGGGNGKKEKEKKDKDKGDGKDSPWFSPSAVASAVNPASEGAAKLYDYVRGGMLSADLITESLRPSPVKPDQSIKNYIDNIRRSALITELYSDDPILSEADPKDVSRAYAALVQNAPEISLNKEVVRSILRQSVNSVAISPFDAKQWADLGTVIARNKNVASGKETRSA